MQDSGIVFGWTANCIKHSTHPHPLSSKIQGNEKKKKALVIKIKNILTQYF